MPELSNVERSRLQRIIEKATGPAPWYWKSFPAITGNSGKSYEWTHHGETGMLAYLVTLNEAGKPNDPLIALNTYCTPFELPGGKFGVWCPEGRSMIRLTAFDPDRFQPFQFEEIVGWFKNSSERLFARSEPAAEFEFSAELPEGTHEIQVPEEFQPIQELGIVAARRALSGAEPACAVFILYPHAQLIQVLPQPWFNTSQFEVGKQWITRITRDPVSHRLIGDGFRIPCFRLTEDGKELEVWLS
jgi:hypothetical protein